MGFLHSATTVADSLKPYEEYLLGGLFLVAGSYAYIVARSWGFAVGTWPRLTAGIVVVLSVFVLIQNHLPQWLRSLIADGDTMFSRRQTGSATTASGSERVTDEGTVSQALVTALFTIGYALAGYLVGFLWATPLFVFTYSYWNELGARKSGLLAVIGLGIAYGFAIVLGVPIDVGVVTEAVVP